MNAAFRPAGMIFSAATALRRAVRLSPSATMGLQTGKTQRISWRSALLATALLAAASAITLHLSTHDLFSTLPAAGLEVIVGVAVGLWLASWIVGGTTRMFWRELNVEQMSWIAAITTIAMTASAYCGYALSLAD